MPKSLCYSCVTGGYGATIAAHPDSAPLTEAYLRRIRYPRSLATHLETEPTLELLRALQLAHLQAVPFENLDVVAGIEVRTDSEWSLDKVIEQVRGGWCFELNGAFGALLIELGFKVQQLAAAVLLAGPTVVADHLCLEVTIENEPYLVDVGFGRSFVKPLALNRGDEQDGGIARFQFIASPQGTTLAQIVDGIPEAQYRFRRAHHDLADFADISEQLRTDPTKHWRTKPFATRLLNDAADRVTLTHDTIKFERANETTEQPVPADAWADTLAEWFEMTPPPAVLDQIRKLALTG